jgi:hypothetical protein
VQRRVGHRDPADEYRLQLRHRRQRAGATDLHLDAEHLGRLLLRRVLVRQGEARRARDEAELLLPVEAVHLVDHAVDRIGQLVALLADPRVVGEQAFHAGNRVALLADREAELLEAIERGGMRPGARLRGKRISEEAQPPGRGDLRVELADRAGRRIARIHVLLLLRRALPFVQLFEVALVHEDLAAHFQLILGGDPQRNRPHGAQVWGHVLAGRTVAARRPWANAPSR